VTLSTTTPSSSAQQRLSHTTAVAHRKQHTRNHITRASHRPSQRFTTNSSHQCDTRSNTNRNNHYYLSPVIRHRRVVVIVVIAHTTHRPYNIRRHTQHHNNTHATISRAHTRTPPTATHITANITHQRSTRNITNRNDLPPVINDRSHCRRRPQQIATHTQIVTQRLKAVITTATSQPQHMRHPSPTHGPP
jgi:hypothetical protein